MNIWIVLKDLKKVLYSSTKKGKIDEDGKISDGHVSIEDYMVCERIWDKFKTKNMGDYHDHYFKKDVLLLADVFKKFIDTCLKYMNWTLVIILVLQGYLGMQC